MMTVSNYEFIVDDILHPWPWEDKTGRQMFWQEVKNKSLIMPAQSMAAISAYIIDSCNKNNTCKKESSGQIQKKVQDLKSLSEKQ